MQYGKVKLIVMIVIIDYATGNIGSIANMLKKIGTEAIVSSSIQDIDNADRLILPGVGAFDEGISKLRNLGLITALTCKVIQKKTPILGICLGMQLFTRKSEEGLCDGLGWIDATTTKFNFNAKGYNTLKIPHMGWNNISIAQQNPLLDGITLDSRFYFVHSYYVTCNNNSNILSTTCYGFDFASSIGEGNIFGVQFHPEKSHNFGMKLLNNFARLC